MYLYGCDLSLESTGISIFDLDTKDLIYVTHIPTPQKLSDGKRLYIIAKELMRLRKEFKPFALAIESTYLAYGNQRNVVSKMKLDRVSGLCLYLFHDCEVVFYTPSEWKKHCLVGNATKTMIQDLMKSRFPDFNFSVNDESDATGLGVAYLIDKKNYKWVKSLKDVPKKEKKPAIKKTSTKAKTPVKTTTKAKTVTSAKTKRKPKD